MKVGILQVHRIPRLGLVLLVLPAKHGVVWCTLTTPDQCIPQGAAKGLVALRIDSGKLEFKHSDADKTRAALRLPKDSGPEGTVLGAGKSIRFLGKWAGPDSADPARIFLSEDRAVCVVLFGGAGFVAKSAGDGIYTNDAIPVKFQFRESRLFIGSERWSRVAEP